MIAASSGKFSRNNVIERATDDFPDLPSEEIERRRDDAVRRALNTPPQPKQAKGAQSVKRRNSAPSLQSGVVADQKIIPSRFGYLSDEGDPPGRVSP